MGVSAHVPGFRAGQGVGGRVAELARRDWGVGASVEAVRTGRY